MCGDSCLSAVVGAGKGGDHFGRYFSRSAWHAADRVRTVVLHFRFEGIANSNATPKHGLNLIVILERKKHQCFQKYFLLVCLCLYLLVLCNVIVLKMCKICKVRAFKLIFFNDFFFRGRVRFFLVSNQFTFVLYIKKTKKKILKYLL